MFEHDDGAPPTADDLDEDDEARSAYQWCLHCERTYKRGEHRLVGDILMCPYDGCNGDTFSDGWDWDQFRSELPQYPAVPELGKKYPMYPPKVAAVSDEGQRILEYLVAEMWKGRFQPHDEGSFCGYKEVHQALGLAQKGPHWGKSLENQGLADLAKWIRELRLPAITGLIVGESEPRLPGKGYYEVNGQPDGSTDWWRSEVRKAIGFDWAPWVPDSVAILVEELVFESKSYLEGSTVEVTREVKERCGALRKRAKELFRDPDGALRCKVCGWSKPPHGMISGDIVELHHIDPIAEAPKGGRAVSIADAESLFVPLCPNCHRMIHARTGGGEFGVEGLQDILRSKGYLTDPQTD